MRVTLSTLLCTVFALAGCGGGAPADPPGGGAAAFPPAEVKTLALAAKPVSQSSEFVATIRSLRSINIQPQVEGFIRQILVKAGDRVRAGQPLVQIDPDKQQASVGDRGVSARRPRGRPRVRAAAARAPAEAVRGRRGQPRGSRAGGDRRRHAEAQLAAIEVADPREPGAAEYYRVTAPTDGIVGDIPVREGDRVTSSTMITTIDQAKGSRRTSTFRSSAHGSLRQDSCVELLDAGGHGHRRRIRSRSSHLAPTMPRSRCW